MARPDFAHSRWPADHQLSLDLEGFVSADLSPLCDQPLPFCSPLPAVSEAESEQRLSFNSAPEPGQTWLQEQQELQETLAQAQTIQHQQTKRINHLEQALDQAMACLDELRHQLQDQAMLETQLAMTEEYANVQQQAIIRLKSQLAEGTQGAEGVSTHELGQALANAHSRIEILTEELEERATFQARLQHTCQEMASERDRIQSRASLLEQQNAELQEQILKQAKQISDYETGVQHWKDRCLASQRQLLQLKSLLERVLSEYHFTGTEPFDVEATLIELLKLAQANHYSSGESPASCDSAGEPISPMRLTTQVNIPEFLLRRRRFQS